MQETTVADLRKNTKRYFDAVESGDTIRVYRRGRPVAEIVPILPKDPAWKNSALRLTIPGISVSREVLKDRSESPA